MCRLLLDILDITSHILHCETHVKNIAHTLRTSILTQFVHAFKLILERLDMHLMNLITETRLIHLHLSSLTNNSQVKPSFICLLKTRSLILNNSLANRTKENGLQNPRHPYIINLVGLPNRFPSVAPDK